MPKCLVCGAGGFIGSHLVKRLKAKGCWVRGVDLVPPSFSPTEADEFIVCDLRDSRIVQTILDKSIDEVYQLAADTGGAGYIFSGENDAKIMANSALININIVEQASKVKVKRLFYSSSACVYPKHNQLDPQNAKCSEDSAYPAAPDSEYGWEKLFSERLYQSYHRNSGLNIRIARFHNIFGEGATWHGGKEKAPAAICRKVAEGRDGNAIEIWGDGQQTRSFLYIDECVDGIFRLMQSEFTGPVNIGSEERVTLDHLAEIIMRIAGKSLPIKHVNGPTGVRGRNSDNRLITEKIGWAPSRPLEEGLRRTYRWISEQVDRRRGTVHPISKHELVTSW